MKNKNTINKILSVFIALLMIFSVSTVSSIKTDTHGIYTVQYIPKISFERSLIPMNYAESLGARAKAAEPAIATAAPTPAKSLAPVAGLLEPALMVKVVVAVAPVK